jgi:probable phosphoglycerate mutase
MRKGVPMAATTPLPGVGRIVLIRHGQTEWSANGRHTSTTDIPLTGSGESRAKGISGVLAGLGVVPVTVWSSPRQRSIRTAQLGGLAIDRIEPDLAEWNYGHYEGLTTASIREGRPGWDLFRDGCPGGESPQDVSARADRLLERAAEEMAAHAGTGDLILVCHGHISRSLTVRWVDLPITAGASIGMDPAGVTVLGTVGGAAGLSRIIQHANVIALRDGTQ